MQWLYYDKNVLKKRGTKCLSGSSSAPCYIQQHNLFLFISWLNSPTKYKQCPFKHTEIVAFNFASGSLSASDVWSDAALDAAGLNFNQNSGCFPTWSLVICAISLSVRESIYRRSRSIGCHWRPTRKSYLRCCARVDGGSSEHEKQFCLMYRNLYWKNSDFW